MSSKHIRKFSKDERRFIAIFDDSNLDFEKIEKFFIEKKIDINAFSETDIEDDFDQETLITEILFNNYYRFNDMDLFRIFNFFDRYGFNFQKFATSILSSSHFIFSIENNMLFFVQFILSKIESLDQEDASNIGYSIGSEASYLRICQNDFQRSNTLEIAIKMVCDFAKTGYVPISDPKYSINEYAKEVSTFKVSDNIEGFEIKLNAIDAFLIYDGSVLYLSKKPINIKMGQKNTINNKTQNPPRISKIEGEYFVSPYRANHTQYTDIRIGIYFNDSLAISIIGSHSDKGYQEKVEINPWQ